MAQTARSAPARALLVGALLAAACLPNPETHARDTPDPTDPTDLSVTGAAPGGRTYDAPTLRAAIAVGRSPDQAAPTGHRVPVPSYAACVEMLGRTLAAQTRGFPRRTLVLTAQVWSEELWASDAVVTFTCIQGDDAMELTLAAYR